MYSFWGFFGKTIKEFGTVWRRFFLISLPVIVIGTVWGLMLNASTLLKKSDVVGPIGQFFFFQSPPSFLTIIVGYLVLILLSMFTHLGLIVAWRDRKKPFSFFKIYAETTRLFGPFLVTWIVSTILVWGSGMLFVIPGIILNILFGLYQFVLVYQKRRSISSLYVSRKLLRGHAWKFFWYGIGLGTIAFLSSLIVSLGMILTLRFRGMSPQQTFFLTSTWSILLTCVAYFFSWFSLMFYGLFYEQLAEMSGSKKTYGTRPWKYWIIAIAGWALIIGAWKSGRLQKWATQEGWGQGGGGRGYGFTTDTEVKPTATPLPSVTTNQGPKRIYQNANPQKWLGGDVDYRLIMIHNGLSRYFQDKGQYPTNLEGLLAGYYQRDMLTNPQNGQLFYYKTLKDSSGKNRGYQLCPTAGMSATYCYKKWDMWDVE